MNSYTTLKGFDVWNYGGDDIIVGMTLCFTWYGYGLIYFCSIWCVATVSYPGVSLWAEKLCCVISGVQAVGIYVRWFDVDVHFPKGNFVLLNVALYLIWACVWVDS